MQQLELENTQDWLYKILLLIFEMNKCCFDTDLYQPSLMAKHVRDH